MSARSFTDEQALIVLQNKSLKSYKAILKELNICEISGSNYKLLYKIIDKYNINTDHILGQKIHKGKRGKETTTWKPVNFFLSYPSPTRISSHRLKLKLIEENLKEHKCEICKLTLWNNLLVPIELHHINGIKEDNRLENLQLLCPNCHAQTSTYKTKNWKNK